MKLFPFGDMWRGLGLDALKAIGHQSNEQVEEHDGDDHHCGDEEELEGEAVGLRRHVLEVETGENAGGRWHATILIER